MTEPFHLKIVQGGLWMEFREFIRLISDLQSFGVDARVENQKPDGTTEFRLCEVYRE